MLSELYTNILKRFATAWFAGVIAGLLCAGAWAQPGSTPVTIKPRIAPLIHDDYGFQPAPGVLPTMSSIVRCGTVCERISDYDSFFGVVRLKSGGFAALQREGKQSSWRAGENLSEVSRGVLKNWPSDTLQPRWTPSIDGYVPTHVVPVKDSKGIFVGVWKPRDHLKGKRLIALFTDSEDRRIERLKARGACVIATVQVPVVALDSQPSLHGQMWPVRLIVRRNEANHAGILGFVVFPDSVECQKLPTARKGDAG